MGHNRKNMTITTGCLTLTGSVGKYADDGYTLDAAAGRLAISQPGVRKLIKAGLLPSEGRGRVSRAPVDEFAARDDLSVEGGELAVLRTSEMSPSTDPGRTHKGFHVAMSDAQMAAACLKYWVCDPQRILAAGGGFVVAISTIPVGVYRITDARRVKGGRHELIGDLLGRVGSSGGELSAGLTSQEEDAVAFILSQRVRTNAGGPMAYLPENAI